MKLTIEWLAGKTLVGFAALAITGASAHAASVRLTGGGTSGESLQVEILEDITISTTSGSSFGGYFFGFRIQGALATYDSAYTYDIATTANPPFEYVTGTGQPTLVFSDVGASTAGGNLSVYFSSQGYNDVLIEEGGSITIKSGTVTRLSQGTNNVLVDPGHTYDVPISAFYSDTERYQSLSSSNAELTSVPESSSALLIALGVSGAVFGCRRRSAS